MTFSPHTFSRNWRLSRCLILTFCVLILMTTLSAGMPGGASEGSFASRRYHDHPLIRLTPLETRLLEAFMLNVGHVLTADSLITFGE